MKTESKIEKYLMKEAFTGDEVYFEGSFVVNFTIDGEEYQNENELIKRIQKYNKRLIKDIEKIPGMGDVSIDHLELS